MTGDEAIAWRPLTAADLPSLTEWLREPRVNRWWNHDTTTAGIERDFGASIRGDEPGEDLVVMLDGRPFGLIQRSLISDYPEDLDEFAAIVEVPEGAVELDYLIGAADLRGHGLGPRMIAAVVADTWARYPTAAAVLVAVVAANTASWRALEKAGLRRVAEGQMTPDNPVDDPLHFIYRIDRPGAPIDIVLVVDVANVMGSRPDGWWRDRRAAAGSLLTALDGLIGTSIVPPDGGNARVARLVAVLEGAARGATGIEPTTGRPCVEVVEAERDGDSAIVRLTEDLLREVPSGSSLSGLVVTADRGLRRRLPADVIAVGPDWLNRLIGR